MFSREVARLDLLPSREEVLRGFIAPDFLKSPLGVQLMDKPAFGSVLVLLGQRLPNAEKQRFRAEALGHRRNLLYTAKRQEARALMLQVIAAAGAGMLTGGISALISTLSFLALAPTVLGAFCLTAALYGSAEARQFQALEEKTADFLANLAEELK